MPVENQPYFDRLAVQEQMRRAQQIEQGQLVEAQELASRLVISEQAVSKAKKAGRMFALEGAGGRLYYSALFRR
jgi:hypothetical protein